MNEQSNDFGIGYAVGRDANNGYGNNGFGFGGDWIWAIILLALIGNGGWGFGGGGYGGGGGFMNYEIGRLATTNDVASGFSTSEIMSDLNDILLGQAQGFAGVQQTLCQGFSGINTALLQGFHGVDNAICTLGYQNQQGFNGIAHQISDCCCATQRAIDGVNYNMAKNTCDIIRASQDNTRAILDYLTNDKIEGLRAENVALKGQISNDRQSAFIIDALAPKCPQPAYVVQPPQQVTFPTSGCGNVAYANYNNGCGCGF